MRSDKWLKVLMGTMVLLPSANAWSAENRTFCFSPAFDAWRNFPAPTIDGVIDFPDEKGWAPAFKYVFNNGTPDPDVVLYGYSDNASRLAMGVTVRNDTTYDDTDAIVMLFDFGPSDGDGPRYGELIIHPLFGNITDQSGELPRENLGSGGQVYSNIYASYFTTNNADNPDPNATWTSNPAVGTWLTVARKTTPDGTACAQGANHGTKCRWDVELLIDTVAPGAPPVMSAQKIFVDVFRADRSAAGIPTLQFTWPQNLQDAKKNYVVGAPAGLSKFNAGVAGQAGTPPTSIWGTVAVNTSTSCHGVWFRGMGNAISDITIDTGTITWGLPSFNQNQTVTLDAHIHNSTVDGSTGKPIAATNVSATFYHAPFGMSGFNHFFLIPNNPGNSNDPDVKNPTDPRKVDNDGAIDPATTANGTEFKLKWTPTTKCDPQNPSNSPANCDTDHQCMLVMLSSPDNDTTFVNQAEFQNMWGNATASTFNGSARISVKGEPPPTGGGPQHVRLHGTRTLQFAYSDGSNGIPSGTLTSQLKWLFHGARFTGDHITIKGIDHEVWVPVSSYGYLVQHELGLDVQNSFEQRHADLAKRIHGSGADGRPSPSVIREVNNALAVDPEQPPPSSWDLHVSGGPGVSVGPDDVVDLELPLDGETMLHTVAVSTTTKPRIECFHCFGSSGSATTPSKVGTLGVLALIGLVAYRRRRR
ncbi:MAG TPA: hypothetical protein VF516_34635 [Kofleriaceae bacterium]